jgi:hypothetical protein
MGCPANGTAHESTKSEIRKKSEIPNRESPKRPGGGAGGEKPAEETALAEFLELRLPAIGTAAETVENLGRCARQRGLALAE